MNKNKLLCILFLFTALFVKGQSTSVSLSVFDLKGVKLEGATVFDCSNQNSLISVTEKNGNITLPVKRKLIFHYQGYIDTLVVLASDATKITLTESSRLLFSPEKKPAKERSLILTVKPDKLPSFKEPLGISPISYSRKLCLVQVPVDAYLASFSINVSTSGKGEPAERADLLIYSEEEGRPGKPLINERIRGELKGKKLVFKPAKDSIFLRAGTYFIGCDIYPLKFVPITSVKAKRVYVEAEHRRTDTPELFIENNLLGWKPFTITNSFNRKTNFYSFGYQIKLKVPTTK